MSTRLSLKERFARRVPVPDVDRVASGSPAGYVLEARMPFERRIDAAMALNRRHLTLAQAHRVIGRLAHGESVPVRVPAVEDAQTFERDLDQAGVIAERREAPPSIDVRAVRERLGCTQEEFAARFGLDLAWVRNWEQGRTRPEAAARPCSR